jgi:hypothetical protein
MHKIEEVLRQLNVVSAKIQPELASHLQQIQQRLDRAHQVMEHRPFLANATQPVLAQVSLAASATTPTAERAPSRLSMATIQQTVIADQPLIVQAQADHDVAVSLWIDPQHHSFEVPETAAQEKSLRSAASLHPSESSVGIEDSVTQPHEPTTPHFVLRQNQQAASKPNVIQPAALPAEAPTAGSRSGVVTGSNTEQEASPKLVPLAIAVSEPVVEVGLPLFESLWFRQAAPNTYTARLVDRIFQKVPDCVPAVLHFCQDIQSKASSSLVCTQIAWEMSRRRLGEVLLVDADYGHRDISRQLGHVYLPGLSESINLGQSLEDLIRPTGVENLSWLPSGAGDISFRRIAGGRWAEISLQLRRRFQWICVHAGAAQDRVTATWGRFCDYSYLITSMSDDLGPATKQVVDLLRTTECRVSGLITID